ncbi:MAG: SBBP repeat-containing protein, partial [Anaerolineae bacterium]|nr:SBBP repeat-containing protein [Anaerolineae bacterium]
MNHLRTRNLPRLWAFLTILALLLATSLAAPATGAAGPAPVAPAAPQLLQFTAGGHVLGFAPDAAWLVTGSHALRVGFEGANAVTPASDGSADDSLPPEGELLAAPREATHGQGGAAPLGRVTYTNLWDGISLTYEATPDGAPGGVAKSTYTLAPGADPAQIRLHYNVPAEIQADGSLRLAFETGQMTESAPLAWQEIAGQRVPVEAVFTLTPGPSPYEGEGGSDEVGFRLGAYDPRYPLTIDPTYQWHTFYGGTGYDYGNAIALDGSGNIYVAGYSSASWQGDGNTSPLHAYTGGSYDIFVLKLNSAGAY